MSKRILELNYGNDKTVTWAIFEQDDLVAYMDEISKYCKEHSETIPAKDINWIKISSDQETPSQ